MTDHAIGSVVAERYELVSELGRGGFATVYAANDRNGGRNVALKLLNDDYDRSARARFAREASVLGRLNNPHTVRMHDSGETSDGRLYIACELVEGEDLSQLISRAGRLDEPAVIHILRQLLEALKEAHGAGLLHRDIKPENVRVFRSGGDPYNVKLLDFGLARHSGANHPSLTTTGEIVGTPRYMSPEQLRAQQLTPCSDLYAVGLLGFELLLGREALHGNRWSDQMERLLTGPLVGTAPATGRVSLGLRHILGRLTDQDPNARYQSAAAVLAELDALERGETVGPRKRALPTRIEERAVEEKRSAWVLPLAVLIVVAIPSAVALFLLPDDETSAPVQREEQPEPRYNRPNRLVTSSADAATDIATADVSIDTGPDRSNCPNDAPAACGRRPPFTGMGTFKERVGEGRDLVRGYVPETYVADQKHPVVILLNAYRDTARDFIEYSGFRELAEQHQFIVVAPDDGTGTLKRMKAKHQSRRKSAAAAAAVLASTQIYVDPSRVFVVAQGIDGHAAAELACESWVTAVATNSYRSFAEIQPVCDDQPRPFLLLSPLKSKRIPVDGGRGADPACDPSMQHRWVSLDSMEKSFRKRHGCRGRASRAFDRPECRRWTCKHAFASCRLDGSHVWPGDEDGLGPVPECDGNPPDFPTAEVIWSFFQKQKPLQLE